MDEIDKDFIDMYKSFGAALGMDDLLITVFARIYIEPDEIAMEDIAKETGYSLASISNVVKMLVAMGFAKKTRKPGSKKLFLYTDKDFVKLFREHLLRKEEHGIKIVKEQVPKIIKKHKSKGGKKLKILENYYSQILKFEEIIQKMTKQLDKL